MPYEIDKVYPWGRSLAEYKDMFLLSDEDLSLNILGCADGPASFNAELTRLGGSVISCDPIYQFSAKAIRDRVKHAADKISAELPTCKDDFNWDYKFHSPKMLTEHRLQTMEVFLEDFSDPKSHDRYITAELPALPFHDKQFDLGLVSNFLFLYDSILDYDFHLKAVLELLRVCEEVRVFPLTSTLGGESGYLDRLLDELALGSVDVCKMKTRYLFIKEAGEVLVLRG